MTSSRNKVEGSIVMHCIRQDPDQFETVLPEVFECSRLTRIELPCSGRVGTGDLMQALAAGYEKVVVLSCGEKSCVHRFGCKEAKRAMDVARKTAKIAGVDTSRLIFIEADDIDLTAKTFSESTHSTDKVNSVPSIETRQDTIPRAFGGALDAVVELQIRNEAPQKRLDWLNSNFQVAGESEKSDVALIVGDTPYLDPLLDQHIGYKPTDELLAAVDLLNSVGVRPVILSDEVDVGIERLNAGDSDSFTILANRNRDLLNQRGVKTIVTICDDIRFTLDKEYSERISGWDFNVLRLADFLVQRGGSLAFMPAREIVAIQPGDEYTDPLGLDSVHKLLSNVPELIVKDIESGHTSTFGGWDQFDAASKRKETSFLMAAEDTGADTVLIPSLRVMVKLLEGRRPGSWEETSIKIKGLYSFLSEQHTVAEEFTGA